MCFLVRAVAHLRVWSNDGMISGREKSEETLKPTLPLLNREGLEMAHQSTKSLQFM
jgi:hypothetical protein